MTGHGRASEPIPGKTLTVELKSVNSRYLDITCKIPRAYFRFEERIKQVVRDYAQRGKIELYISFDNIGDDADQTVTLNRAYLKSYLECLYAMRDEFGLKDDISVSKIAENRDVFVSSSPEEEEDEVVWASLEPVLRKALSAFFAMKKSEGEKMHADILEKLFTLEEIIGKIKERLPDVIEAYRDRLTAKLREALGELVGEDASIAESRIVTEVAIFADKTAVDEEMVRLSSHFSQFRAILSDGEAKPQNQVGRKLDFLLQEINREINTTGSKVSDAAVASLVVDAKSEAEKIREQIQNIE